MHVLVARERFRAKQAAAYLGVHEGTLYRWTREGRVGYIALGNRYLYDREELDRFLQVRTRPASDQAA